jgi:F0F1-type ATP synthase assembly protein I
MKSGKEKVKYDYPGLMLAFGEASKLSISFVLFPVIFLVLGVFLDKKFQTVPFFILLGLISGFFAFVYQVRNEIKRLNQKRKK